MNDDFLNDFFDLGEEDITHVDRTTYERAPFGMPGGKTNSLMHILPRLPVRRKWVEHFGGSGVISWNRPDTEIMVYNDRYSGVVAFYRCLQSKRYIDLVQRLEHLTPPLSREEWIHARTTWCTETDDIERAAKWFYTIKCSVIGKGQAFARATNSKPPITLPNSLKLFEPLHQKLQGFIIENLDWRVCVKDYDSFDCVHYFDPPYVGTDTGIFEHKFTRENLKELLHCIGNLQGFAALSGYADTDIDACDFWDERISWSVPISSEVMAFTKENNKQKCNRVDYDRAEEVLWLKEAK